MKSRRIAFWVLLVVTAAVYALMVGWTLPLIEGLPAQTLHFQDWYLDPATGLLFNSPGLAVPIVK